MSKKSTLRIAGYIANLVGVGATLLIAWVADKQLDEKISEKISETIYR